MQKLNIFLVKSDGKCMVKENARRMELFSINTWPELRVTCELHLGVYDLLKSKAVLISAS